MKHQPLATVPLTGALAPGQRQVGSSAGAARPRKDIEGAQRSAQAGQNPAVEGKAKSRPDQTLERKGSGRETAA
jgi:hypothetical protein